MSLNDAVLVSDTESEWNLNEPLRCCLNFAAAACSASGLTKRSRETPPQALTLPQQESPTRNSLPCGLREACYTPCPGTA